MLARAIEIQIENFGVTTRFFLEIIKQQLFKKKNSKIQSNVWRFFQIEALLSLKNVGLPQIFVLNTKSTC